VRWRRRKSWKPVPLERLLVLRTLAELSKERGGGYVPTYMLAQRLGRAPDLGTVLEELIRRGLVERSLTNGGWGERPTDAGYRKVPPG
jgi:hypothetical protein